MKNNITIEYCTSWGYLGRAVSLTEKLLNEHKKIISSITLIPSSNGIYDIYFNESRIFSKDKKGDFPGLGEAESMVRKYINNEIN